MLACEMRWCDKQCNNQFSFVIEHSKKKSLTSFANLCPSQKGLSRKSFTCFSIHIYIFLIFASGVYGTQRMNHHIFHWPFLKCHHCANSYCTNICIYDSWRRSMPMHFYSTQCRGIQHFLLHDWNFLHTCLPGVH